MITTRRKYWLHISSTNQAKPQVNTEVSPQNARNFGLGRGRFPHQGKGPPVGWEHSDSTLCKGSPRTDTGRSRRWPAHRRRQSPAAFTGNAAPVGEVSGTEVR